MEGGEREREREKGRKEERKKERRKSSHTKRDHDLGITLAPALPFAHDPHDRTSPPLPSELSSLGFFRVFSPSSFPC